MSAAGSASGALLILAGVWLLLQTLVGGLAAKLLALNPASKTPASKTPAPQPAGGRLSPSGGLKGPTA